MIKEYEVILEQLDPILIIEFGALITLFATKSFAYDLEHLYEVKTVI